MIRVTNIPYCIETLENDICAPSDVCWRNCWNTFHQCQITSEHFTGHKWAENMLKTFEELQSTFIHKMFFFEKIGVFSIFLMIFYHFLAFHQILSAHARAPNAPIDARSSKWQNSWSQKCNALSPVSISPF